MLTPSAANAFLLTLEEPPSHAVFILATTNPESLPQTILSRCQQFAFSKISKKALISRINYVLEQEKMKLDDNIVNEIADLSDGGLRDALSILDQLITLNKPITVDLLNEQFGIVSETTVSNLVDAIILGNIDNINSIFESLKEYGYNEKTFINKFISVLTSKICELSTSHESNINYLKEIVFEIIKIDNYRVNFNFYDVIKMIIVSNITVSDDHPNTVLSSTEEKTIVSTPEVVETTSSEEDKNISQEIKEEDNIKESLPNVNLNNVDLVNIRVNNSFVNADKKMKSDLENCLPSLIDKAKKDSNIYSLIIDIEVGVVSPTNILFVSDTDASANLLNEKDNTIASLLEIDKKIVFVSKDKWNKLVDDFKRNKGKVKYEYIEEPIIEKKSEIEDLANNIFGNNIIVEE
jgi:DNA polymerase-3 subunit gamma/tau